MSVKTIMIEGKPVMFKATAATPIYYRELCRREFIKDMQMLVQGFEKNKNQGDMPIDDLSIFENVAYCMAKQADPNIPDKMEWYDGFDMFTIYEILPHIIELWGLNQENMVGIKKNSL